MFDLDKWQEILFTIRKNKLRTFLTAFSVAWGIFMLMILLGAGTGLLNGVKNEFRDQTVNSVFVRPGQTSMPYKGMKPGRHIRFTNEDYSDLKNQIEGIDHITGRYFVWQDITVRYNKRYSSFSIRSCHPDLQYPEIVVITSGRFINDLDVNEKRKVAVLGDLVVDALFQNGEDPLGKSILINKATYKVVGTFTDAGGEEEEKLIYIPITTAQLAYRGGNRLHNIVYTTGNANLEESQDIVEQTRTLLADKHQFSTEDPRALRIWSSQEEFQSLLDLFAGINLFIWIVGIGTIIAGIVGISNIMLIVVKERTREIGLRKAMGATPASIIFLILMESVVITTIAGYMGLLFGVGLIESINWAMVEFQAQSDFFKNPEIRLDTALLATAMLVGAGTMAGYFPARRAAAVNPIEALRDE